MVGVCAAMVNVVLRLHRPMIRRWPCFFDAHAQPVENDVEMTKRLCPAIPGACWAVTNQAHRHRWLAPDFGQAFPQSSRQQMLRSSQSQNAMYTGHSTAGRTLSRRSIR